MTLVIQEGEPGHTVTTREMRLQQIHNRKAIERRQNDMRRTQLEEDITNMSIAERLMRRTELVTFDILFKDDFGEFNVKTRLMSSLERDIAFKLNTQLNDVKKYKDTVEEMKDLARQITVTPGMGEYFGSDKVTDEAVIGLVMTTAFKSLNKVGDRLESFRRE
jgi:hypothetical protein